MGVKVSLFAAYTEYVFTCPQMGGYGAAGDPPCDLLHRVLYSAKNVTACGKEAGEGRWKEPRPRE